MPDKGEIISSLKLGIPLIVAGFLLALLAGKWSNTKSEKFTFSSALVVLAVGIIIGGIIVMFPAILWFEAVVGGILSFAMAILFVILIIVGIGVLIRKIGKY